MTAPGPNLLLIGAARSGTTTLASELGQLPHAYLPTPKEPHFLALGDRRTPFRGPGDEKTIEREIVRTEEAYRGLYSSSEARAVQWRIDASASTMYYASHSVERITQYCSLDGLRLIAVLRNPVDRAWSAYQYLRVRGFETAATLANAVRLEAERKAAGYHHLWHYTDMGRYAEQLDPFREAFGDRLLLLDFEQLSSPDARHHEAIAAHMGRHPAVEAREPAYRRANASGAPRNALARAILHRVARSRFRTFMKHALPPSVVDGARQALLRPTAGPDPTDRMAVLERVHDDIERLSRIAPTVTAGWLTHDE